MRKTTILTVLASVAFNALAGAAIGVALDLSPLLCAIGNNVFAGTLGAFAPALGLRTGIYREIWTGELIKSLRAADQGTWLDGVPDFSQYAENDAIHLVNIGADPDVLINNTTYPIPVQTLADGDAVFSLDKFQTKATPITDDELHAISYDKIQSVKERHAYAITEAKYIKAIHALAPSSNVSATPVIATTGDYVDGTSGRRRLRMQDIVALKDKFDKAKVPIDGRRLVLCTDHVNDLLLTDQKFKDQYYNYTTGKIANLYGFAVYEYVACPLYTTSGTKKAYNASADTGEYQASVAFYTKRVFKATGSTKTYISEASSDPENQRNLLNYRHYFIVLPQKQEAMAAIYSSYTAPASEDNSSDSDTGA